MKFLHGSSSWPCTTRLTIANPTLVVGFELNAIAVVIIGGTSLSGGRGSLVGTLLGAAIIGVIANRLILMSVTDFIRQIVTGLASVLAAMLDPCRGRLLRQWPLPQP